MGVENRGHCIKHDSLLHTTTPFSLSIFYFNNLILETLLFCQGIEDVLQISDDVVRILQADTQAHQSF